MVRFLEGKRKVNIFKETGSGSEVVTGKSLFVTGVGRSGTHFIASLFGKNPEVDAFHMDDIGDAVGDSFVSYCRWYNLQVSTEGFLRSRAHLALKAQQKDKIFLESNPMIAFLIGDLAQTFDSRFVIMVRDPRKVVESHCIKGWYRHIMKDTSPVPGYQYFHDRPNHFFSRIMPTDPSFREQWFKYTQQGKVAWMWRATYERIFSQLQTMADESYRVVVLDDFHYSQYHDLCSFLDLTPGSSKLFDAIVRSRPGKGKSQFVEWTDQGRSEYKKEVGLAIGQFHKFGFTDKWLEV